MAERMVQARAVAWLPDQVAARVMIGHTVRGRRLPSVLPTEPPVNIRYTSCPTVAPVNAALAFHSESYYKSWRAWRKLPVIDWDGP